VRIERLGPALVAAALGYGAEPEKEAWDILLGWMADNGLFPELKEHRFFGFNNPGPSPGSPNYGYEQWVTVNKEAASGEQIEIKEFPGGLYAVTTCKLKDIGAAWQKLVAWSEDGGHRYVGDMCLEELLTPWMMVASRAGEPVEFGDQVFDLWLPVLE